AISLALTSIGTMFSSRLALILSRRSPIIPLATSVAKMRLTWGEILIASAPVPQPISKRVSERRIYLSSREIDLLLIQVLTKFRLTLSVLLTCHAGLHFEH